jgi:hypothetical protein
MVDYHQIADQIRAFVESSDQTPGSVLENMASAYAHACGEVNQRLSRCHRLLQQGLRSEAIQLARSQPPLLDAVAALDFPERAAWDELARIHGLASAPRLAVDHAQALQEAQGLEDPLHYLLQKHRRLALARAPIKSRLRVMRKLALHDANNPIWSADVRVFEQERFRELEVAATQAAHSDDLATVSQLLAEVNQQKWLELPPKSLIRGLRKAEARLRRQEARATITELDSRLNVAFAGRDPIAGRLARRDWLKAIAGGSLGPDDPIWERVGPALKWLEEQDRLAVEDRAHDDAVRALAAAVDQPSQFVPAELERLARAVLQLGRGMPAALQERYLERRLAAEARQTRRRWAVGIAVAAGIVLVVSLAFSSIRSSARTADALEAAAALSGMLERGEVDRAEALVKRLQTADPELLSYPPMSDALEKLQVLRDNETNRALEFDKAVRAAEQAPAHEREPAALATARKLARLQTEKDGLTHLEERRAADRAAAEASHENQVGPQLDKLGDKLARLQQRLATAGGGKIDDPEIERSLSEAGRTLSDLAPELPYVAERTQGLAATLGQKLDTIRAQFERRRKQAATETEMTDAVAFSPASNGGELTRYANGLDQYIKLLAGDARAATLKQTRQEQSLWNAVEAWNALVASFRTGAENLTSPDAAVRAELCKRFITQYPGFPDSAQVAVYTRHLEAIARRHSDTESATSKLLKLLSDFLVEQVWMVTTSTGKRYYTKKEPTEAGPELLRFMSIIDFNGKELSKAVLKPEVASVVLAPQSRIADRFNPILTDPSMLVHWEDVMLDLVEAIIKEPEIDPILQIVLLRKVVESAMEGSEPLRLSFDKIIARLDAANVDVAVPWMNPEIPRPERNRAAQFVQSLRNLLEPRKQVLDRRDQIERTVMLAYRSVGWLKRTGDGWKVQTGASVPAQGDLWVVVPVQNRTGEWQKVGAITKSKLALDARDSRALAECRPVFVIASLRGDHPR